MPSEPVIEHELSDILHELEAAEPKVASTPPGIDTAAGADRSSGTSPWRLWEIATPTAGSR